MSSMMITNDSRTLFNDVYHAAYDFVTSYTAGRIREELEHVGLHDTDTFSREQAEQQLRCLDSYRSLVHWALAFLVQEGHLVREGAELYRWTAGRPSGLDLRERDVQALNLHIQPSLTMIDYVAYHWLAILNGESQVMQVMFGAQGTSLWESYFNNAHDLYSVHNQWAAESLADCILPGHSPKILELGAGYGSAARALVEELRLRHQTIAGYVLTDVSPLLAGKARRLLAPEFPEIPFSSRKLDMNRFSPADEDSYDFIYAVNTVHCGSPLSTVLGHLRELLTDKGQLIISECVRADYDVLLHQEFLFSLLPGFYKITGMREGTPCFGFRTAADWGSLLMEAGYAQVNVEVNSGTAIRGAIITAQK